MSDELDQMIRRHRDDLGRAQRRRAARRGFPVRRVALAGAVVGPGLGMAAALLPGNGRVDVVQEARAALKVGGEIEHYRYASYAFTGKNAKKSPVSRFEVWAQPSTKRSRYVLDQPDLRVEIAYADGVEYQYDPERKTLLRITGLPALSPPDQIAKIRRQLDAGVLRDSGEAVVDGRTVRRLVGTQTVTSDGLTFRGGKPKSERLRQVFELQYDVDSETYAPVRIQSTEENPPFHDGPVVEVLEFSLYERLAANPENEKLLGIDPPPGTKVTVERVPRRPPVVEGVQTPRLPKPRKPPVVEGVQTPRLPKPRKPPVVEGVQTPPLPDGHS